MDYISLLGLNQMIKRVLNQTDFRNIWLTAEIAEIQLHPSGHCYLQLAEKDGDSDTLLAQARATIWANTFRMLRVHFEQTTGQSLSRGMKLLINADVVFHEIYGYSLNIKDIDPTFTLGDIERKRREIIERLENEGIINLNRELEFPLLPKRIAIISSATAAGYGDFTKQLENNRYGYQFQLTLFPTTMQGDQTAMSVLASLERIAFAASQYDVVVIIRGGGAQLDLAAFDDYTIAKAIATFPLPILAGIGHERDETIADRVAYLSIKTPTAVAAYLVDAFVSQEEYLNEIKDTLKEYCMSFFSDNKDIHRKASTQCHQLASNMLLEQQNYITRIGTNLGILVQKNIASQHTQLANLSAQTGYAFTRYIEKERNNLDNQKTNTGYIIRQNITSQKQHIQLAINSSRLLDPKNILSRGFSITRIKGRAIKNAKDILSETTLETEFFDGKITSIVK